MKVPIFSLTICLVCLITACDKISELQNPGPTPESGPPLSPQQRAMAVFPDLANLNSPLNREFVRHYNEYQKVNKTYFNDPDWPMQLAQESNAALTADTLSKQIKLGWMRPEVEKLLGSLKVEHSTNPQDHSLQAMVHNVASDGLFMKQVQFTFEFDSSDKLRKAAVVQSWSKNESGHPR
jgi:hypothetical protein